MSDVSIFFYGELAFRPIESNRDLFQHNKKVRAFEMACALVHFEGDVSYPFSKQIEMGRMKQYQQQTHT